MEIYKKEEVKGFLNDVKSIILSGANTQINNKPWKGNKVNKTLDYMAKTGLTQKDIEQVICKLQVSNYSYTDDDVNTRFEGEQVWLFGINETIIDQDEDLYIKLKIRTINGKHLLIMSFHPETMFLSQASDEAPVTHLALQKLLYFTQSWSMALLDKAIFCDNCQAWAHGAVYPNVYVYFRWFKFKPLPKINKISAFNEKELKILNAVKSYYFDIYSPKALEEICHCEEPYKRARKEHVEGEICNTVIDKKNILYYYKYISEKYNIDLDDMTNIKKYLNVLLSYGNCLSNC